MYLMMSDTYNTDHYVWHCMANIWLILSWLFIHNILINSGWWFQPLWTIWKSNGEYCSQLNGQIIHIFQTTNQIIYILYTLYNMVKSYGISISYPIKPIHIYRFMVMVYHVSKWLLMYLIYIWCIGDIRCEQHHHPTLEHDLSDG